MTMQHAKRGWTLGGLAIASMLTLGACADVDADALENDDFAGEESDDLAQLFPRADAGAATTPGTDSATPREDLGVGDGKDVIMMGDSWMSLGLDGIQEEINAVGNKRYRKYGVAGTKMLGIGLGAPIPTQFDAALRADKDIKTVIMTGGGNDVLLGGPSDCRAGGARCKALLGDIVEGLKKLWEKMAANGVKDVVYIGYSEGAGNGAAPPEFTNTMKNGTGEACLAMTSLRCTPVETTPIVRRDLKLDGIHPTAAANKRVATEVLKLMNEKGMRR